MEPRISEGQGILIDKVINKGICVKCGACVGLCPYFHYYDGRVVAADRCCADTWKCLQFCPRADYEETSPDSGGVHGTELSEIGPYQKIMMARANDKEIRERAQYGGIVSALLIYGLEKQLVKSAIVTDFGGSRSPAGKIVKTRSEVLNCAGSRYSASASLSALNRALKSGEDKLAIVGLPCQMEALARMRVMKPHDKAMDSNIVLKIGIFCTWALDYRLLEAFLKTRGVQGIVIKYDIPPPPSEKFRVQTEMGWRDFALPDVRALVQKGCSLCLDMTAEQADISVGNAEGLEGWNTVVVRTDFAAKLIGEAAQEGWLETGDLPEENFGHLKEAAHNKRQRGNKARIASVASRK